VGGLTNCKSRGPIASAMATGTIRRLLLLLGMVVMGRGLPHSYDMGDEVPEVMQQLLDLRLTRQVHPCLLRLMDSYLRTSTLQYSGGGDIGTSRGIIELL